VWRVNGSLSLTRFMDSAHAMHFFIHRNSFQRRMHVVMSCALALTACSEPPLAPSLTQGSTLGSSPFRSSAFILDVNTSGRTVKVSPPTTGIGFSASTQMVSLGFTGPDARASLLGSDAVEMRVSNYRAGAIGAVIPGKVLVTFELTLINRLHGVQLGTPTFPKPPAGKTGVQAFPFEVSIVGSAGGVGTSGNEVLVKSPSLGAVVASSDWDGEPHSFFNDAGCGAGSNDCFRYEPFGTIGSEGASTPRQVGFLLDPTVRDFRIRLLLAADLREVGR